MIKDLVVEELANLLKPRMKAKLVELKTENVRLRKRLFKRAFHYNKLVREVNEGAYPECFEDSSCLSEDETTKFTKKRPRYK
jgi:hypothetical protein